MEHLLTSETYQEAFGVPGHAQMHLCVLLTPRFGAGYELLLQRVKATMMLWRRWWRACKKRYRYVLALGRTLAATLCSVMPSNAAALARGGCAPDHRVAVACMQDFVEGFMDDDDVGADADDS
jgi:hypothetical protein